MTPEDQLEKLKRGTVEIVSEQELLAKLKKGTPLNIKLGVDPTAPDVHLGFTVVMRKLKVFQNLGHQVILIMGDYTATVGDPSGKNKTRPLLDHEEVLEHAKTYQEQFFKILDREKTKVVYNGDWFSKLTFTETTKLMSQITVAQMLEREDFQNRYKSGQPISLHEFLYPMMQGYDSVMIDADVELGGTDQRFNVLRGRDLQKNAGKEQQVGLFMPLLIGTDGKEKMSKSLNNYIGISESPQTMYHKLYNLPDAQIQEYFTLLTDLSLEIIDQKIKGIESGSLNPNTLKKELAGDIVSQYHGGEAAIQAEIAEAKIHAGESLPDDMPQIQLTPGEHFLPGVLVQGALFTSNGEARRMIEGGGVSVDGVKITDPKANLEVTGEHVIKVGKRKFLKILLK